MTASTHTGLFSKFNKQTLLFFLHNFFTNVGTTLVYVSANVLLLENHPEYSLPIAYVAAALTVMLAGKIYEHYEHHLALRKLSLGTMLASLFMVAVVMILLSLGHGVATAIAIMVGFRVIYLLVNLEFWGLSALVFDVRQSKRLFGVIGSGDMPAKALGAVLATLIHSPSVLMILLVISLAFFALAFYTQILTFRHTQIPDPHHARPRRASISSSKIEQKYFAGNKLLTALCLGIVAIAAAATWIEYHFFVNVKYKFHSQHDIIVFVGSVLTGTYLISTFVKTLFSGKVVERFGIKLTLYLLPLTTILVSLGLLISSYIRQDEPSLLVYYCVAYLLFEIVRRTIFDPVFLVLFQPLSTKNRLKGHTLAKGLYEPMGMFLAGTLLWIIYSNDLSNLSLTFDLSLLFALVALFFFRKSYSAYILELKNAISKRFIQSGELPSPADVLPIIKDNLGSERKEEVINAIDWLAKNNDSILQQNMDSLLKNPNVQVRYKALEVLSAMNKPELTPYFFLYIESEPDTACQTLAVRIACASSKLSDEKLARYLAHQDNDIVRGAIVGSWEAGKSLSLIHGTLRKLLRSKDEISLKIALTCLQEMNLAPHLEAVKELLVDGPKDIKSMALELLITQAPESLNQDIEPHIENGFSKSVIAALINAGDPGNRVLTQWLQTGETKKKLTDFVHVAEKNRTSFTQNILLNLLKSIYLNKSNIYTKHIDRSIHFSILKSFSKYPISTESQEVVSEFIHKEITASYQLLDTMDGASQDRMWQKTLQYELDLAKERLFYIFMALYDKDAIHSAWKGIRHNSNEKKANSIEMIENLIPRSLYPALQGILEDHPIAKKREFLFQYVNEEEVKMPLVDLILKEQDRRFTTWTIALAITKVPQDIALPESILNHANQLIREVSTTRSLIHTSNTTAMKHDSTSTQISEMERIIVLKNTQLFSNTPENVLSSIAPIMREVRFVEGQEVFAKGDLGDSMYVIYAGEIGIYDGTKQLALFDKGEIFGELALLDTEPRSATTIAESDVLLFRIDQEDFYELMEERDEILRNVLRILCQRIRIQNEKMRLSVNP